jgi:hypothetical protein
MLGPRLQSFELEERRARPARHRSPAARGFRVHAIGERLEHSQHPARCAAMPAEKAERIGRARAEEPLDVGREPPRIVDRLFAWRCDGMFDRIIGLPGVKHGKA